MRSQKPIVTKASDKKELESNRDETKQLQASCTNLKSELILTSATRSPLGLH